MAPQSGLSDCSGPVKCHLWLVNLETHLPDQGRGKKRIKRCLSRADDGRTEGVSHLTFFLSLLRAAHAQ